MPKIPMMDIEREKLDELVYGIGRYRYETAIALGTGEGNVQRWYKTGKIPTRFYRMLEKLNSKPNIAQVQQKDEELRSLVSLIEKNYGFKVTLTRKS